MQRLKTKHKIYILLLIAFIGITIIFWRKNHTTLPIVEAFSSDTTIVLTNRKGAPDKGIDTEKYKPSIYTIINVKFYSKDNFEEFVAFTFLNTSTEIITNIMFEESHYRIKKKTSDFTNKKLILKPKDSINFTFKKNHDKLFVQKIRFATGKTITFEDELFNDDNTIYDKLWERKN